MPEMTGLSLMNPWHAVRTLFNPELIEDVKETRHSRSIMENLNPKFLKAKDFVNRYDRKFFSFGKRTSFNDI